MGVFYCVKEKVRQGYPLPLADRFPFKRSQPPGTVIAEKCTVTSKLGYNGKGRMKFLGNESRKSKKEKMITN